MRLFLIVLGALVLLTACSTEQTTGAVAIDEINDVVANDVKEAETVAVTGEAEEIDVAGTVGELKEITIRAYPFSFDPDTITVNVGDIVRLTAYSEDGMEHGIAIPEFGVEMTFDYYPKTVEFVADKAGTFPFSCSLYCGPGHRDMKGKLVVNP